MAALISVAGTGGFQAPNGQPVALGKMTAELQGDVTLAGSQICGGRKVTFNLDANGNIASGSLWAPATYLFTAYTAQGQQVWQGSVNLTIPPSSCWTELSRPSQREYSFCDTRSDY